MFGLLGHRLALGFEFSADGLDAAGVLRNDLPVALERAPLRGDAFATLLRQLDRAYAAIHEKMPVVIGQVKSVLCFFASAVRSSLMVVSLPFGTFFYKRINLERSWDNKTAFAVLRQIFGIEEFSIPINAQPLTAIEK